MCLPVHHMQNEPPRKGSLTDSYGITRSQNNKIYNYNLSVPEIHIPEGQWGFCTS